LAINFDCQTLLPETYLAFGYKLPALVTLLAFIPNIAKLSLPNFVALPNFIAVC
jgi:hypothetical protein